jgi:hypothetical protein
LLLAVGGALSAAPARADEAAVVEARREFVDGLELVKRAEWAEALGAFERSLKLRPHPITVFNIGACERALGRYTRARATLKRALADSDAQAGALPDSLVSEARGFLAEIERILVHLDVTISPASAAVAVDGRPLEVTGSGSAAVLVAGTVDPGPGAPPPGGRFELLLDPGTHLLTLSRAGFRDVVVNRTFAPGAHEPLVLELERLPATLHVASNFPGAVVRIDDLDVGTAPVDVARTPGSHLVQVLRRGFVPYRAAVTLRPGEAADLKATLEVQRPPLWSRWWFWTALGGVLTAAAVSAYAITWATQTPSLDGGGLQWVARLR